MEKMVRTELRIIRIIRDFRLSISLCRSLIIPKLINYILILILIHSPFSFRHLKSITNENDENFLFPVVKMQ